MRKLLLISMLFASLIGCDKKGDILHLTVVNQSASDIENIKIYTFFGGGGDTLVLNDSLSIGKIAKGQTYETDWDLSKLVKADGSYYLTYEKDSVALSKKFGYYSNGILLDKKYNIRITDNEVIVTP